MIDTQPNPGDEARLVRLPEVMRRAGLGKTKIYDMVKKGEFPAPRKAGRASLWLDRDVTGWIGRTS